MITVWRIELTDALRYGVSTTFKLAMAAEYALEYAHSMFAGFKPKRMNADFPLHSGD